MDGNVVVVQELIAAGYDAQLFYDGIEFWASASGEVSETSKKESFKQAAYEMIETLIASKVLSVGGQTIKLDDAKVMDSFEKIENFYNRVQAAIRNKEFELTDARRKRLEKIMDDVRSIETGDTNERPDDLYRVRIKKDFLEEATAGVGPIGCFSPDGVHREMPPIHGLEANSFFIQIFDENNEQTANAVVILTKKGAFVYKAYNTPGYDMERLFGLAIAQLSKYVPRVYLSGFSAGVRTLEEYAEVKQGEIELEKPSTLVKGQYFDDGIPDDDGNLVLTLNAPSVVDERMLKKHGFFKDPENQIFENLDLLHGKADPVEVADTQVIKPSERINWEPLPLKLIGANKKEMLFLVGTLKNEIDIAGSVDAIVSKADFHAWLEKIIKDRFVEKKKKMPEQIEIDGTIEIVSEFLRNPVDTRADRSVAVASSESYGGINFKTSVLDLEKHGLMSRYQWLKNNLPNISVKSLNGLKPFVYDIQFIPTKSAVAD